MVVSQHYAASRVGADVLAQGGNAIDAAVAASLMIGTVEPWMSGLGGGGYLLYYEAASGRTHSIEFGMRAPLAANPDDYPLVSSQEDEKGGDLFAWPLVLEDRNIHGPLSIATPGYMAGIETALNKFGTRFFADLIAPAVESAERGMPVDWYATVKIASAARELSHYADSAKTYLPGGFVPASQWTGSNPEIKLGNLARTLRRLQKHGPEEFYQGETASMICADLEAAGSSLRPQDLTSYQTVVAEADRHDYRDACVYAAPGLSAGPTLRDTLQRLEQNWNAENSQDRRPDINTHKAHADALTEAYDLRLRTLGDCDEGASPGCTTHLSCVDRHGNMVALTQTLLSVFGSRVMLPQTGLLMNNGMMWFDPRPDHPNSIGAGKKPLSNMCPTIFETVSGTRYALGASGGRRIMPAVMQLISYIVDFGMDVDEAMHFPRIDVSGAPLVSIDQQLGDEVVKSIASHHTVNAVVNSVHPVNFACPNIVSHSNDGTQTAAAFINSPWAAVSVS